jgi:SagB-type dehydrogenase family enzyme
VQPGPDIERVYRYHDGTKHYFDRFAPSLGYLDWASQPRPFRSFDGAPVFGFAPGADVAPVTYARLFEPGSVDSLPLTAGATGIFLRHALGLSAWKAYHGVRWSLRVNPSSGNLHPTEGYIVTGPLADCAATPGVWHYAPDRHAIERRCEVARDAWTAAVPEEASFLVVLTSIYWRESWKYGERGFRYCQHDVGHAIGALAMSAALCGWRLALQPAWTRRAAANLIGVDRDDDYVDAEREEPACVMLVTCDGTHAAAGTAAPPEELLEAPLRGRWFGRASQLSEDHVRWAIIDDVSSATEDPGHEPEIRLQPDSTGSEILLKPDPAGTNEDTADARRIILQRRSAVAFDGSSAIGRAAFLRMLARTLPRDAAPWNAIWWSARIHLAIFVHRVNGVDPGLYLLARSASSVARLKAACNPTLLWTPVVDTAADRTGAAGLPLFLLDRADYRGRSQRVSCDQDIASDGFFSLGMIADFQASLELHGASFYRHLFWESGLVGQVLYLEAEAAGARATGIGCFYDEPVHRLLGLEGHAFQSLYHFTVGMPIEDGRLTTEPGYPWESVR